jgi:hypothetical protein
MSKENAAVAILNTHTEAEKAGNELHRSGFDRRKRSIVGRDYHTEEHVVGDCNAHPLDHRGCLVLLAGGSFTLGIPRREYQEFHERFEK